METTANQGKAIVAYEYKDVTVNRSLEALYTDSYENFGWKMEGSTIPPNLNPTALTLKFKRDRKIRNKAELSRLERQFVTCADEVQKLEGEKRFAASAVAYTVGMIGAGLTAGSVYAFMAGSLPLIIGLTIPALLGWILPYILYTRIRRKKDTQVTPLIDSKYDEIYDVCLKANSLLAEA